MRRPRPWCLPTLVVALLVLSAAARPASAAPPPIYKRALGTLSLAFTGGYQYWLLDGIEESLGIRNDVYATEGYSFESADYGPTYAFGAELQVRLTRNYFARVQAEWTRLSWEDRDRTSLLFLGGRNPTPVSLGYKAKVQSRPLLFALGAGRSFRHPSVRWGFSGNWVIAPLRVVDEMEVFLAVDRVFEVESTGTAHGFEAAVSVDYFTDSNMNLFVETFWRLGGGDVEVRTEEWASSILPSRRHVDLDGGGLRLGFRWI